MGLAALLSATVVNSRLVVYGPPDLKKKFEFNGKILIMYNLSVDFKIEANYANFGHIPYG